MTRHKELPASRVGYGSGVLRARLASARWALSLVLIGGSFGCFHKVKVPLQESQAEVIVQNTMKTRLWPVIHVTPDSQIKDGWSAAVALEGLDNTLAQSSVDITAGQVTANCMALAAGGAGGAPAQAALYDFIDPAQPPVDSTLEDETRNVLENLRAFSAYFEVDLLHLLEDPATGPDATIYQNLPHYPIVRQDTIQLGEALQGLKAGVSPATPQIIQLTTQTAEDWSKFLMEFHAAYLTTEVDTILFVATWLPLDPDRYENLANNGLPRFAWVDELNDIDLNQGNAIWAHWTWDESYVSKVEMDLSQLTADLQTVQAAWRTEAQGKVDLSSPAAAAASLCAQATMIAMSVSTGVTGTPASPPAAGTDLHNRLSDTFQLAQKSPDPDIRGIVPTPTTGQ